MRRWLENGFNEWGRPFFYLGVLTMLIGALNMMIAHADLGAFAVKAGAIECMAVLFWGWALRGGANERREEAPRRFVSRDRARRAIRENFPDDAEQILSDIKLQ